MLTPGGEWVWAFCNHSGAAIGWQLHHRERDEAHWGALRAVKSRVTLVRAQWSARVAFSVEGREGKD